MIKKTIKYAVASGLIVLYAGSVQAEYTIKPFENLELGVGGYARFYSGKLESYQYNNILKAEPKITMDYRITSDLSLKGKFAYRIVRNDRFADKKTSKVYDAYGTLESKRFGTLDVGKLRSVAYLFHQGSVDVSFLDVEDSDISYFYKTPKNFYAPTLTYLYTDSRDPKVSYTTPEINGLTLGATVVQSEDVKPDSIAPNGVKIDHGKGVITAAKYKYNVSDDIWAAFSGGFAFYQDDRFWKNNQVLDANHREYSLGTKLGWKNFTVGIAYKRMLFPDKISLKDSSAFSTGIAYEKGKYGVSLSWLHSQAELTDKNKYNHIMLSNSYQFNKYVKGFVSAGKLEFDYNNQKDITNWFGICGFELKI